MNFLSFLKPPHTPDKLLSLHFLVSNFVIAGLLFIHLSWAQRHKYTSSGDH